MPKVIMDYYSFLKKIEETANMTEFQFYFSNDLLRRKFDIIYHRMKVQPFCIKKSNDQKSYDFSTVEEMAEAKIFNGKSLREEWDHVVFTSIY